MRSDDLPGAARSGRRSLLKGACAAWLVGGTLRAVPACAADLRVGAPAPPATLVTLDGERITTTDLRGQVVILTFWATWCAPCREELPRLSEYSRRHAEHGLRVLGFGLDAGDQLADVRKVAAGLSFPVGFLADSSAPGYGRIWRLPVNFTIDRNGRLAEDGWKEKTPGWTPERLEQLITPLLS